MSDITEHPTEGGKVYLGVVLDAFSRRVIGWSIADHLRAELVVDALQMAIWRRQPAESTVVHSDHGTQYTSWAFGRRLRAAGLLGSMGTVGDAYDNAVAESFFGTLQLELLDRHRWSSRDELASAMFEWIECFSTTRPAATHTAGCSVPSTTRPSPRHDQQNQPVRKNGPTSIAVGISVPVVSGGAAFGSAAQPAATVGMPFAGTWASNALVPPPYTAANSSYPAVNPANNGGDWSTDLWAAEGTPITLLVTSADGPVTFVWDSSTTSCGTSSKVEVFVNGTRVGWIFYGHLLGGRGLDTGDPQPTNGMTLGTVHDFGNGCNDGPHLHIEMSNHLDSPFSCWTDNGQPGTTLAQGAAVGMLGTHNSAPKQSCTDGSFVTTPDTANWQIVGSAPLVVDNWAPFGTPQPTTTPVADLSAFHTYPADGTVLNAQPSNQNWEVVGGAPLGVDDLGTLGNPRTFIVNDDVLTATTQFSFGHLRQIPADGTVVQAEPSGTFWTVNGGCRTSGQLGSATPVVATDFGINAVPVCPTAPDAPTGVTATVSGTQASVQWTAPADNRSSITHYTVTASPGGETATVTGTQATISGLSPGTYTFTVVAANGVGDGPSSSPSNAVTVATAPDAPTGVTATVSGTQASVQWTAPADNRSSIRTTRSPRRPAARPRP